MYFEKRIDEICLNVTVQAQTEEEAQAAEGSEIIIPDKLRRPAEVERDELRKQLSEARAEIERFNNLFKNGIECFMSPCAAHSGENTPPFDQFMEKYGRKCTPCLVCEIERKDKLIEQMREALKLALPEARSTHCENTIKAALAAERGE